MSWNTNAARAWSSNCTWRRIQRACFAGVETTPPTEATVTMLPPPDARMGPRAARDSAIADRTLSRNIRAIASGAMSSKRCWTPYPALLTSTSRRPQVSMTFGRTASVSSSAVRSAWSASASPPAATSSSRSRSSRSRRRATSATRHPRAANIRDAACPMPLDAPVTTTTRGSDPVPCDMAALLHGSVSGLRTARRRDRRLTPASSKARLSAGPRPAAGLRRAS